MNHRLKQHYAHDPFESTRMSFGEHIEVLRRHLLKALVGFLAALTVSFFFAPTLLEFIAAPVSDELMKFYERRLERAQQRLEEGDPTLQTADQPCELEIQLERASVEKAGFARMEPEQVEDWIPLKVRIRPVHATLHLSRAERLVGRPPLLSTLTITEPFTTYFKVSVYCGIVLSSPWIFYQLWSFVAAGLYPHEKRLVNVYLPVSLALFLAGVAICEFVVLPRAVAYLLSFNEWLDLEPELRLGDWLSFAIMMPLVFGLAFQTPVVMLFTYHLGILDLPTFKQYRKHAYFILAVLAAVLTASPDLFSMLALMFPLWALYELGIVLCWLRPRPTEMDIEKSEVWAEL